MKDQLEEIARRIEHQAEVTIAYSLEVHPRKLDGIPTVVETAASHFRDIAAILRKVEGPRVYRGWINAPSTLDTAHKLHGVRGIVVDDDNRRPVVRMYPAEGPVTSFEVPRNAVSRHWL